MASPLAVLPGVSHHAIDRYREHHPRATKEDLLEALRPGVEVDPLVAWQALCRRGSPPSGERYVLPIDFTGLFVVAPPRQVGWTPTVVTYLRFSPSQRDFFMKSYGVEPSILNHGRSACPQHEIKVQAAEKTGGVCASLGLSLSRLVIDAEVAGHFTSKNQVRRAIDGGTIEKTDPWCPVVSVKTSNGETIRVALDLSRSVALVSIAQP